MPNKDLNEQKAHKKDYSNSKSLNIHKWSNSNEAIAAIKFLSNELLTKTNVANKAKKRPLERHLNLVLINLYWMHLCNPKGYIGFSRNNNFYSHKPHYKKLKIGMKSLLKVIDGLEELGYVEVVKGVNYPNFKKQSLVKAKEVLIKLLVNQFGFHPDIISVHTLIETIRLKNESKDQIIYPIDTNLRQLKENVIKYNEFLQKSYIDIDYPFDELETSFTLFLSDKFNYRVFNNRRFDNGGRYYGGWWSEIPREYRSYITINGSRTIELDFATLHISLLYLKKGLLPPTDDVYILDGYPNTKKYRQLVKDLFLCIINSNKRNKAIKALRSEIRANPDDYPELPKGNMIYEHILTTIEDKHPNIKEYFNTGVGVELQYYDSLIASYIINKATKQKEPILCIHDSFICRRAYKAKLEALMIEGYKSIVPTLSNHLVAKETVNPVIKPKDIKPAMNDSSYLERKYNWKERGIINNYIQIGRIKIKEKIYKAKELGFDKIEGYID